MLLCVGVATRVVNCCFRLAAASHVSTLITEYTNQHTCNPALFYLLIYLSENGPGESSKKITRNCVQNHILAYKVVCHNRTPPVVCTLLN